MLAEFKIRLCAGVPNLSKALRRRGGGGGGGGGAAAAAAAAAAATHSTIARGCEEPGGG